MQMESRRSKWENVELEEDQKQRDRLDGHVIHRHEEDDSDGLRELLERARQLSTASVLDEVAALRTGSGDDGASDEDDSFTLNSRSTDASGMHSILKTTASASPPHDEKNERSSSTASVRRARRQVRWADVCARRRLARSQQMGFVPGRTDWLALADDASGHERFVHEALAQVKHFDPLNDPPSKLAP